MIRAGKLRKKLYFGKTKDNYGNASVATPTEKFIRAESIRQAGNLQNTEAGASQNSTKLYRTRFNRDIQFGTLLIDGDDMQTIYKVIHIDDVRDLRIESILTVEKVVK